MIQGRWFQTGADITLALELRTAVFGRGRDELDDMCQQVVVFDENGAAVGSARLGYDSGAFRLRDVGVLETERGKGYGDLLVRLLIFKALTHEARLISLTCSAELVPFFERYGFEASSDGAEADMLVSADKVSLSHCSGHCAGC